MWGPEVFRRKYVFRIPMRVVKGDWNRAASRNSLKRMAPYRVFDEHVKERYEMSMAWELDCRSNFFFSPPAHLCAVTYVTEILLNVTLSNQPIETLDQPRSRKS